MKTSKRTKTVFSPKEVPHIWAKQEQESGRAPRSSIYFEGPTIYSYGRHFPAGSFAEKADGSKIVFLTYRTYSNTTAKHLSSIRYAVNQFDRIFCYDPKQAIEGRHHENLSSYLQKLKGIAEEAKSPRLRYHKINQLRAEFFSMRNSAFKYVQFFYNPIIESDYYQTEVKAIESVKFPVSDERINELQQRQIELDSTKTEREQKRNIVKYTEALASVEAWKAGEGQIKNSYLLDKVYLRATDDNEIQTSKGARVSVPRAREVYFKWRECNECIEGMEINGYKVNEGRTDHVTIGCHYIERDEILELASKLNW